MARMSHGQVVVSGAPQALHTGTAKIDLKSFVLRSHPSNATTVYFGSSTVTNSTGFPLAPGESFSFNGSNESGQPQFDLVPDDVYVVGTAPDAACWFAAGRGG